MSDKNDNSTQDKAGSKKGIAGIFAAAVAGGAGAGLVVSRFTKHPLAVGAATFAGALAGATGVKNRFDKAAEEEARAAQAKQIKADLLRMRASARGMESLAKEVRAEADRLAALVVDAKVAEKVAKIDAAVYRQAEKNKLKEFEGERDRPLGKSDQTKLNQLGADLLLLHEGKEFAERNAVSNPEHIAHLEERARNVAEAAEALEQSAAEAQANLEEMEQQAVQDLARLYPKADAPQQGPKGPRL
jgi:hypothetical protein